MSWTLNTHLVFFSIHKDMQPSPLPNTRTVSSPQENLYQIADIPHFPPPPYPDNYYFTLCIFGFF